LALAVLTKLPEDEFKKFLSVIKRETSDGRTVKKAINWASDRLETEHSSQPCTKTAAEIQKLQSRSARWIAADAIRELESEAVQRRLGKDRKKIKENRFFKLTKLF
jgi:3-methyladenine DNA glycosylase AlkD